MGCLRLHSILLKFILVLHFVAIATIAESFEHRIGDESLFAASGNIFYCSESIRFRLLILFK